MPIVQRGSFVVQMLPSRFSHWSDVSHDSGCPSAPRRNTTAASPTPALCRTSAWRATPAESGRPCCTCHSADVSLSDGPG